MKNINQIGKLVQHFQELGSTNDFAIEWLKTGTVDEGSVVSAAFQSSGRGQMGTTWQSAPGENLMMSIILKPSFLSIEHQFYLNMMVSLAVRKAVQSFTKRTVSVKWPNDIYIGEEKVAGILIQTGLQAQQLQWAVIGIGLNVGQTSFDSSLKNPTSLAIHLGNHAPSLSSVQVNIFDAMNEGYAQLAAAEFSIIHRAYMDALFLGGLLTVWETPDGNSFNGAITGVQPSGKLLIQPEGSLVPRVFDMKEVKWIGH